MSATFKKSRKARWIALGVLVILLLSCMVLLRDRGPKTPSGNERVPYRVPWDRPVVVRKLASPPAASIPKNSSGVVNAGPEAGGEANASDLADSGPESPLVTAPMVAHPTQSRSIAIVNLERVMASYQPSPDSEEARSNLLQTVKRIVAARATEHRVEFVVDVSTKGADRRLFVLATNEVLDLTDEVLLGLGP